MKIILHLFDTFEKKAKKIIIINSKKNALIVFIILATILLEVANLHQSFINSIRNAEAMLNTPDKAEGNLINAKKNGDIFAEF